MATYLDELRRIQRELRHQIRLSFFKGYICNYFNCLYVLLFRDDVYANIEHASSREAIGISILVVVLLVSPVIIFLVRNAAATIQMYALNLSLKAKELKKEKRKSDTLLYQMLPLSVATQLKQTQKVIKDAVYIKKYL